MRPAFLAATVLSVGVLCTGCPSGSTGTITAPSSTGRSAAGRILDCLDQQGSNESAHSALAALQCAKDVPSLSASDKKCAEQAAKQASYANFEQELTKCLE